jgi:predicted hotdog family 3-hydroxylacyl-ACP dehydratase
VVNIHVKSAIGRPVPHITIEDHWGTPYRFRDSASLGSRNLQVFTPSVPFGTRSLTIRSVDDADARLVVTFAVPLMLEDEEMGQAEETVSRASRLQRPA